MKETIQKLSPRTLIICKTENFWLGDKVMPILIPDMDSVYFIDHTQKKLLFKNRKPFGEVLEFSNAKEQSSKLKKILS